jgi:hypothetical protein
MVRMEGLGLRLAQVGYGPHGRALGLRLLPTQVLVIRGCISSTIPSFDPDDSRLPSRSGVSAFIRHVSRMHVFFLRRILGLSLCEIAVAERVSEPNIAETVPCEECFAVYMSWGRGESTLAILHRMPFFRQG